MKRAKRLPPVELGLLTFEEACTFLRCGETFLKAHKTEIGYVQMGRVIRFRLSDLDAWIARNRVQIKADDEPTPIRKSRRPVRLVAPRAGTNPVTGKPWGYYDAEAAR